MARRVPQRQRVRQLSRTNERSKSNDVFVRLGLLLFCGLGLASGFVYAGRQHFTALGYGYKTQELRRERDRLAEEQRRYLLEREAAASPIHLEQAAKRLGMQPLQAAQIDPLRQAKTNDMRDETRSIVLKSNNTPPMRAVARNKPTVSVPVSRARKPI